MKKFEIGVTGLIMTLILLCNIIYEFIMIGLITLISILIVDYYNCKPIKIHTNQEIAMLGELIGVDGSCNNTITYLYKYKGKDYLLTYVGDMHLLNPNNEAVTV